MLIRVLCATVALFPLASWLRKPPPPPKPAIVNVMPAFWRAWDSTRSAGAPARAAAFRRLVVAPNRDVYDFGEFRRDLADTASVEGYLRGLQPEIPAMRVVSTKLAAELPSTIDAIVRALPGLSLNGVTFYILPSFNHFNGQIHGLAHGGLGVLFGIDGIVEFDTPAAPLTLDVAHELFHIYQFQTHPGVNFENATLWEATWGEGSAAYASRVLTPGATRAQALMSSDLAILPPSKIALLACGIRDHLDSRSGRLGALYFDLSAHPRGLPARGGYLVGYLIAQDFARQMSIAQMGRADLSAIEPRFRRDLGMLCATGTLRSAP